MSSETREEITTWDVYVAFRKAQANFHSRPYRLPKDWEKHLSKMSKANQEAIKLAADRFNTRWSNINMDKFFEVGFDLIGKSFTYTKFFDNRVVNLYVERDKISKRNLDLRKSELIKSAKFVRQMRGKGQLKNYARERMGQKSMAVHDYIKGNIDQYFLTWLIKEKYLLLEDEDRSQIPYIVEKYREYCANLDELKQFTEHLKEKL